MGPCSLFINRSLEGSGSGHRGGQETQFRLGLQLLVFGAENQPTQEIEAREGEPQREIYPINSITCEVAGKERIRVTHHCLVIAWYQASITKGLIPNENWK